MERKFLVRNFQKFRKNLPFCPLHSSLKISGNSNVNETINNVRGLEMREITQGIIFFLVIASFPLPFYVF